MERHVPDDETVVLGDPRHHLMIGNEERRNISRQMERIAISPINAHQQISALRLVGFLPLTYQHRTDAGNALAQDVAVLVASVQRQLDPQHRVARQLRPARAATVRLVSSALTGGRPTRQQQRALDAALVCVVDHELAASTVTARIAVSTRADPWMCLATGLAALQGPRHGATSGHAVGLLRRLLRTGALDDVPYGFGHRSAKSSILVPRSCSTTLADEADTSPQRIPLEVNPCTKERWKITNSTSMGVTLTRAYAIVAV